jgi:hypothetical protein
VLRFAPADGLTTRALWAIGWLLALLGLAIPRAARRCVPRGAADKPAETR